MKAYEHPPSYVHMIAGPAALSNDRRFVWNPTLHYPFTKVKPFVSMQRHNTKKEEQCQGILNGIFNGGVPRIDHRIWESPPHTSGPQQAKRFQHVHLNHHRKNRKYLARFNLPKGTGERLYLIFKS
jgi:hypothetical protein